MGSDYYESPGAGSVPRLGVGENTVIENAIIDKNARVGNNCTITPKDKPNDVDHPLYFVRDGIVIIPKNGIVPHGTVI
jgi:glucose-1-phosphate adenylyltransferase